jgi:predicted dehydrogenase
MARHLRWGILATGSIANQFAEGLKLAKYGELVAVGSRTLSRAEEFCAKHGGKAYGSYEEVLADPNVDAVYIATPHHTHMADTIAVAKAGKAILCEKPFTLNAHEAKLALDAVNEAGVFFMEAFMYRCSPEMATVRQWIAEGRIGDVKLVNSEFAFQAGEEWANFRNDAALGGGGLMDVGTYCVSLSRIAFGEEPVAASYLSQSNSKGVDWIGSGQLEFSGKRSAVFTTGVGIICNNGGTIYGTKGRIKIDDPWKQAKGKIELIEGWGNVVESIDLSTSNAQLYAYEADTVAEYIDAGECPFISKNDTMEQMRSLDLLRKSAGIEFSAEVRA